MAAEFEVDRARHDLLRAVEAAFPVLGEKIPAAKVAAIKVAEEKCWKGLLSDEALATLRRYRQALWDASNHQKEEERPEAGRLRDAAIERARVLLPKLRRLLSGRHGRLAGRP
jgi:hypothetical protein